MNEAKEYPILKYLVNFIREAIADAPVTQESETTYLIKDGNDEIRLTQVSDAGAVETIIEITDLKCILTSEDLLDALQHIELEVTETDPLRKDLESTQIIVNGLNIETEFIFQGARSFLDELSTDYEFYKMVIAKVNHIESVFKFGDNLFGLVITNEKDTVQIKATFPSSFDAGIKKTVIENVTKVEVAVNKMFK